MQTSRRGLGLGAAALAAASALLPLEALAYQRRGTSQPPAAAKPAKTASGPVLIVVSTGAQKLWVYDNNGLLDTTPVSTGTGGYPTPTGVFAILEKKPRHFSNIYGGAPMPYMQRLTMSGVALHQGVVTGRPASHGCVRLPPSFAPQLFQLTKLGGRVIVMSGEAAPVEFSHPALFVHKPMPSVNPDEIGDAAERSKALASAIGTAIEGGVMLARIGSITAWRRDELKKLPVSVFVSKADARVYVRHGFSPLFDAPIKVGDPERPLGTHVYTAIEPKGDSGEMRWTVVTSANDGTQPHLEQQRQLQAQQQRGRNRQLPPSPPPAAFTGPASNAAQALERIEIPDEVRARVSDMLSVGATLIVSDEGVSHEMRVSGTDFVVLTR